jgi:hypothetical protein
MKYEETIQACSTHGELRIAYKIVVEKPEGKKPLWWWEDIDLLQLAVVTEYKSHN